MSKGGGGIGVGMDGDRRVFGGLVLLGVPLLLLLLGALLFLREKREESSRGWGRKEGRDLAASLFSAVHSKCSSDLRPLKIIYCDWHHRLPAVVN